MLNRIVCLVAIAFGHASVNAQAPQVIDFANAFQWVRSVELAQTNQVLTVSPRIKPDPRGGWLVIDPPEGQVRLYDIDGHLKAHFGRRGEGPGEFRNLVDVIRTQSGPLIAVDAKGRLTTWSHDASSRINDFTLPITNITDAELVGRDTLLLVTPPRVTKTGSTGPILHLVDLVARKVVRSFYEPSIPNGALIAWTTIQGGSISISGDIIGVTSPLLDSIIVLSGSDLTKATAKPLRLLSNNTAIPDPRVDRAEFMNWVRRSSWVGLMHANNDGWLIPRTGYGTRSTNDLLFYPRIVGRAILIRNAPILIGVASEGEFIFLDPDQLEPQHVRTARFRLVDR